MGDLTIFPNYVQMYIYIHNNCVTLFTFYVYSSTCYKKDEKINNKLFFDNFTGYGGSNHCRKNAQHAKVGYLHICFTNEKIVLFKYSTFINKCIFLFIATLYTRQFDTIIQES